MLFLEPKRTSVFLWFGVDIMEVVAARKEKIYTFFQVENHQIEQWLMKSSKISLFLSSQFSWIAILRSGCSWSGLASFICYSVFYYWLLHIPFMLCVWVTGTYHRIRKSRAFFHLVQGSICSWFNYIYRILHHGVSFLRLLLCIFPRHIPSLLCVWVMGTYYIG